MSRRLAVLCIIAFITVVGGLSWFLLVPHEPVYDGRPLSAWLDEWDRYILAYNQESPDRPKHDRAQVALRQIGAKAIPTLLEMAGRKEPGWKKRLIALANKQSLIRLRFQPPYYDRDHSKAADGFSALGTAAQPAIPALIVLLRDEDRDVRASAALCLSMFGPSASNAVPALVQVLDKEGNGWGLVLLNSMLALSQIHSDPDLVVPVLREYLDGPRASWNYSAPAMWALRGYGPMAKSTVPAILPYLNHPDADKRQYAEAALWAIDPQALDEAKKK